MTILNVKGFQEDKVGRPIDKQIQNFCEENNIKYDEVAIPGDTSQVKDIEATFSMDAYKKSIKEKIVEILDDNNEDLTVVAYSLAARPAIDAISELADDYKKRTKLRLINPAYNPLYAIRVMDWVRTDSMRELQTDDYYLKGEIPEIFLNLIIDWNGDAVQFQKDLQSYVDKGVFTYEEFNEYITTLGFDIKILNTKCEKDLVIHNQVDNIYSKERKGDRKVVLTHCPKLNHEVLESITKN